MKSVLRRRAVQGALLIVPLTAGWCASASALPQLPPPPITLTTLTLPTVTLPPVTSTVVTTPPVTTPPVTLPPTTPPAPPRLRRILRPTSPSQPSAPGAGATAVAPAPARRSGETSRVGGAERSREQASRLRLAHDRRTLVVVLPKPGLVELLVRRVAPECRLVEQFRVHGHRGANRVRLGNRPLTPGTYTIVARSVPSGRIVGRARVVVVDPASDQEIRARRKSDVCRDEASAENISRPGRPPSGAQPASADPKTSPQPTRHRGALGTRFARSALSGAGDAPFWVYALLALAVGLLGGAAALPKRETLGFSGSILMGFAGATILLGLTIFYALG